MSSPASSVRAAGPLTIGTAPGYLAMPLPDPTAQLDEVQRLFGDVGSTEQRALLNDVVQALRVMLGDLGAAGAVYCGVGRHTSPTNGSLVTSTLVVSVLEFPEPSDPRALLEILADADVGEGGPGEFTTTISGRPVGLQERVRTLPAPTIPGADAPVMPVAPVYQLQVRLPSFDGTKLATIELSTPFVGDGPQFRTMVFQLAASAGFDDEPETDE